jgi:hypothetical protein
MLNFQFNSVSRPHPLRRGERRATESGERESMGWDGGERESGDRQRVKRCVRFVCNAFDSVAEMCGVDRERKEKKRKEERKSYVS